jgi:hypothetical protein
VMNGRSARARIPLRDPPHGRHRSVLSHSHPQQQCRSMMRFSAPLFRSNALTLDYCNRQN